LILLFSIFTTLIWRCLRMRSQTAGAQTPGMILANREGKLA
jgi:hypothetical protein